MLIGTIVFSFGQVFLFYFALSQNCIGISCLSWLLSRWLPQNLGQPLLQYYSFLPSSADTITRFPRAFSSPNFQNYPQILPFIPRIPSQVWGVSLAQSPACAVTLWICHSQITLAFSFLLQHPLSLCHVDAGSILSKSQNFVNDTCQVAMPQNSIFLSLKFTMLQFKRTVSVPPF